MKCTSVVKLSGYDSITVAALLQGDAGEEGKRGVRISQGKMNVLKRGPSGHSQGSFRKRRSVRGGGGNVLLKDISDCVRDYGFGKPSKSFAMGFILVLGCPARTQIIFPLISILPDISTTSCLSN